VKPVTSAVVEFDDSWTRYNQNGARDLATALAERRRLLTEAAATVAAGIVSKRATLSYKDDDAFVEDLAHGSVTIAQAILDEVMRRTS
jgi:hypothetical protein